MPRLAVWSVRAALIYLVTGFTLGLLLLIHKGVPIHPALWRLLPAHIEFLLLGWTLQLALGVAFWILPRFYTDRGTVRLAWLALGLLNAGIWLTVTGFWLDDGRALALSGRALEAAAVALFAVHAWPRIKPPGV